MENCCIEKGTNLVHVVVKMGASVVNDMGPVLVALSVRIGLRRRLRILVKTRWEGADNEQLRR